MLDTKMGFKNFIQKVWKVLLENHPFMACVWTKITQITNWEVNHSLKAAHLNWLIASHKNSQQLSIKHS